MKKRIVIVAVIVLAIAGGVTRALRAHWREQQHRNLVLYGNVDIREVNLGFRVSGRVAKVLCDEGDPVHAGELIAQLDDEPYRRELDETRAQAAALRARVQLLEAGNRPQEIEQARALLREREVTAENAERLFKRQQDLLASKAVSVQDRDDAEAHYREAEARVKSAREQLRLQEAGFRPEEIAQAKADLARAEAAQASAALHVEDTQLKAPADGVVLTRAQEPGAVLQPGTTILTVSLTKPVWSGLMCKNRISAAFIRGRRCKSLPTHVPISLTPARSAMCRRVPNSLRRMSKLPSSGLPSFTDCGWWLRIRTRDCVRACR